MQLHSQCVPPSLLLRAPQCYVRPALHPCVMCALAGKGDGCKRQHTQMLKLAGSTNDPACARMRRRRPQRRQRRRRPAGHHMASAGRLSRLSPCSFLLSPIASSTPVRDTRAAATPPVPRCRPLDATKCWRDGRSERPLRTATPKACRVPHSCGRCVGPRIAAVQQMQRQAVTAAKTPAGGPASSVLPLPRLPPPPPSPPRRWQSSGIAKAAAATPSRPNSICP